MSRDSCPEENTFKKPRRPGWHAACAAGLLLLLATALHAQAEDRVVEEDEAIVGGVHEVPGVLMVRSGATLEVRGAHILVGSHVHVEEGGRLVLGPWNGEPAQLSPLDPKERFWIHVEGHVESQGTPRTVVSGLAGRGLDAVLLSPGGFKVAGSGDLRDIVVKNGTAGIIVEENGTLRMEDAEVRNLYLMGVASLGTLELVRTEFADNSIGVSGKGDDCRITIRDSVLDSWAANVQLNRCPTTIQGSSLLGGSNSFFTVGAAHHTLEDVEIRGYLYNGVLGDGYSQVDLRRVLLEGGTPEPYGEGTRGVMMTNGHHLVLEDVEIRGHSNHGVDFQSGRVTLHSAHVHSNGGAGLRFVNTDMRGTFDAVDFGSGDSRNEGGAVSHARIIQVVFLNDQDEPLPPGTVEWTVEDALLDPLLVQEGSVYTSYWFESFRDGPDGRPVEVRDVGFTAYHPDLMQPARGSMDLAGEETILQVRPTDTAVAASVPWPAYLLVGALVLVLAAVAARALRGRRHREGLQ